MKSQLSNPKPSPPPPARAFHPSAFILHPSSRPLLAAAAVLICAVAWSLHAPHFHVAYLTAWCFSLALFLSPRPRTLVVLAAAAVPVAIGVATRKLALAPLLDTPLPVLLWLAAAAANARKSQYKGPQSALKSGHYLGISSTFFAFLTLALTHSTPWFHTRWTGDPLHPSQWGLVTTLLLLCQLLATPYVPHRIRPYFATLTLWLLFWWVICPTKHTQRIPYGSLWMELATAAALGCMIFLVTPSAPTNKEDTGR